MKIKKFKKTATFNLDTKNKANIIHIMLSIKSKNSNYLARVVKLPTLRKHSNADRLQCVTIAGCNVITGLNAKEGDLYVYFPLECSINKDYLSYTNSFREKERNRDDTQVGFFDFKNGRVKAVKLRGERSEGYIAPTSTVEEWLESKGQKISLAEFVDVDFDTICGELICEKYINPETLRKANLAAKQGKKAKKESKLIENQFRLHSDTAQLKRNIKNISPEDIISVSEKYHGANASFGRVLCKRKLSLGEKVLRFFGGKIQESEYDYVFSSRRVIKNLEPDSKDHFYDCDIWTFNGKKVSESIQDGVTLYGELVGQTPTGAWIQKEYDYGTEKLESAFYVFRITYTTPEGRVYEFSTPEMIEYCNKFALKYTPVHYYGKAKDLYPDLKEGEHWHENFLAKLMEDYTEGKCKYCSNKVPREGVVLKKESLFEFEAYKLKSFEFLQRESSLLDRGETNIEDEESRESS